MYATLDQLRAYLGQVPDDNASDALLSACLVRASDIVRSAIRAMLPDPAFDFAAYGAASAQIIASYPASTLVLPPHQAGSVIDVSQETGTQPATYTSLSDSWMETAGGLYRAAGWRWGRYQVVASWGYGPVPSALEELTLELAVNLWRAKDRGGYTEVVGVEGSGGLRVISGLNRQQQQIVETYVAQVRGVSI